MTDRATIFDHERLHVTTGPRSGLAIAIAVHSTALGPALGGCRIWTYPSWRDAVDDALRLSAGMTSKNALAGLAAGGGKAVIQLPPGESLTGERRRAAFLDLGESVAEFDGGYRTAEDVGTSSADMAVVAEITPHVRGLPSEAGGHGDPAEFTARGVHAALTETLRHTTGSAGTRGRRMTIVGLGQVGSRLATRLAEEGVVLTLSDIDHDRRAFADALGARWVDPGQAHRVDSDVFVPAGVGGMLTPEIIEELSARAVVGPANNQLSEPGGAELLAARGIVYAPDYLVNAGGVIYLDSPVDASRADVLERIDGIGATLAEVLEKAERDGTTAVAAADGIVESRLRPASTVT